MNTAIIVQLDILNRRSFPVTKRVPRGTIIEVSDPNSDAQHAMVVRDYVFTLPPSQQITVYVEAMCFVRRRTWPQGVAGNLTPYTFSGIVLNQQDLWSQMDY